MRYYSPHGVKVDRGAWPQVFLDGQQAPAGTVVVDGRFFSVQYRRGVVVTCIDAQGIVRQPRPATVIDELREAICTSKAT